MAQDTPDPCVPHEQIRQVLEEVEAAAAEEGQQGTSAGRKTKLAQLAVEAAEALATRACANPLCTTLAGTSEADMPKGLRCAKCQVVRYCGKACQTGNWRAHQPACRELRKRLA